MSTELEINQNFIVEQFIPPEFFLQYRTEVTIRRLHSIKDYSNKINNRFVIGRYQNEIEYSESLNILNLSTQETRNRKIVILKKILPLLHKRGQFLDVGCGKGDVTKIVSKYFNKTTIIDINLSILSNLKILKKEVTKKLGDINNIALENNKYDFILLSHSIYYIPEHNWGAVLDKLYDALNNDGLLVIILSEGLDKQRLSEHFGGNLIDANRFVSFCAQKFKAIPDVLWSLESFLAIDPNSALQIASICLNDASTAAPREECLAYLNKYNYSFSQKQYEIHFKQKFIIIKKNKK